MGSTGRSALTGHVRFAHVNFAYPTRPAQAVLRDFNLELLPGTVTALVGPSGGGKSTVVSLLARFYDAILPGWGIDSGSGVEVRDSARSPFTPLQALLAAAPGHTPVPRDADAPRDGVSSGGIVVDSDGQPASGLFFDGQDIRSLPVAWVRAHIALVAQEPVLFASTIKANISYGVEGASDRAIRDAAVAAHADAFITGFSDGYVRCVFSVFLFHHLLPIVSFFSSVSISSQFFLSFVLVQIRHHGG